MSKLTDFFPVLKYLVKKKELLKQFCKKPNTDLIGALKEIAINLLNAPLSKTQLMKIKPFLKQLNQLTTNSIKNLKALIRKYGARLLAVIIPIAELFLYGSKVCASVGE